MVKEWLENTFLKNGNKFSSLNLFYFLLLCLTLFFYSTVNSAATTVKTQLLEKVNLQLKWRHQFQFAGYYAAKQQGYYAEEGLDVHIYAFNQDKPVVQQVVSGEADYGIGDVGILFNYANGQSIKALAAIFQHNPLVFISKETSGIISPFEIKGKRVMQRETATDDAPLRAMLADVDISKDQYTSVKHSFSIEDLVLDKVDVMSGYITDQPFALRQQGVRINVFKPQNYGVDFYGDILFTSDQEIAQFPGRTKRFVKASLKGWKYAFEHTEEIIQLIKQQYHSQSSIEHLRYEAKEARNLVLPDTIALGEIKVKRLRYVADIYERLKLSRKLTDNELAAFIHPLKDSLNLNQQERQWLKSHPVIRMGIDPQFAPYQWVDSRGRFQGISADYIRLIEQRLGVKFKIINDKQAWNEVLDTAKQGGLDLLSCLVKTPDREEFLNFSEPYLTSSAVIIAEYSSGYIESLKKLAGKRVAIQKGHYTQELLSKHHPEIEIVSTKTVKDALRMVSEGQVKAYVGDVTSASYVMKKEGFLNLTFSGTTPYQSQFRFGSHKNLPLFASIISKALASIEQQEKDAIYNRWHSYKVTQGIDVRTLFKYVILTVALFLVFSYWVYRLRRSENALKTSEAKLQLILDTEPECVKVVDADGCLLQMNPTGLKMIDVDNINQVVGQKIDKMVVEEYRESFNAMNAEVLKGNSCNLEFQIKGLSGKTCWVESHSVPLVDETNHTISILAITRDISDRKKTEDAQKLVDLLYNNTSDAMMVLDDANLIIAINPAFSKITGYDFEEVEGKPPSILQSGIQDDSFYKEMWASIIDSGHWQGEIWNKRKNGDLYAERLVVNTIFSDDGKVEHRVALFSDITERKEAEKIIWDQANYDQLTRLPNRNMFLDRLGQDIKISLRSKKPLALIFLDLDNFKDVNDTLGHDIGDELLCEAAKRLSTCVRESDTVARLGGDEFIIILAELEDLKIIDRVAQKIIQQLSQFFILANEQVYISASLGVAIYPNDTREINELIKFADQAMYISKAAGRGKFSYFTLSMQEHARFRMQLLKDLRVAIKENQFQVFYQPIVDTASGKICKAEALIRWSHPARGMISLTEFIPIAEESGLIIDIGDFVFKEAARQVKRWRDLYCKDFQIGINKSPVQFQMKTDCDECLNYLEQIDLTGDAIIFEITEDVLMGSESIVNDQIVRYRGAGIQLSLDNFGIGYSSLSYLKKFDIDYLKIDQTVIANLALDSTDLALSEAIILLSHKLGVKVIAEGIETDKQRELLINLATDFGQGYLFSKPVSGDEFEVFLRDNKVF